jgi:hypothetical protein
VSSLPAAGRRVQFIFAWRDLMKRTSFGTILGFILLITLVLPLRGEEPPLVPLKTETPPIIDGVLDDPVWQKAPSVTGFKTFIPDFDRDMPDKTIAYYAYDRENLYFAFKCYDSEPDKIKTSVTRRDNMYADDFICINLDSFNDQQGLYALYVNPTGIQGDSRFAAGQEDSSVDFVWYSGGKIDDDGYSIEIQIPLKSIRFANKEIVEMSVLFERRVSRRSEHAVFPPMDPAQGYAFLTQMQPMVYQDLKHFTLFELLPAITYGQRSSIDEGKLASDGSEEDLSLTTKLGITSDLILDGTYNPDFSQVESDAGQVDVNLRFALFFSEKRPFFLEGKDNFNFAGSSSGDPLSFIVHTRQIVDPITGIKLSGKMGEKNTLASIYAADELRDNGNDTGKHAHFAILRYKRKLSGDSYLGAFYTGREIKNGFNRVVGTDGQLRINKSSIFGYHGILSDSKASDQSTEDGGHAIGLDYSYGSNKLGIDLGFHDISDDFHTETGFITRTGISKVRASVGPKFYPNSKIFRRIDPRISSQQTRDKPSDLWETDNTVSLRFIFQGNANISFSYEHSTEVFLAQRFDTNGWGIVGGSQVTKELAISLFYNKGKSIRFSEDPFQGKGSGLTAIVSYQPSGKLNAYMSLTYADLFRESNSEKIFDVTIIRNRITYQMNRYLFFRGIVEHNSLRNTLLTDFLASFTYIPGTVLHFGYGSFYEKIKYENGNYIDSNRFLETRRGFFAKASYLWRL